MLMLWLYIIFMLKSFLGRRYALNRERRYVVKSDIDDQIVFGPQTVAEEARRRRITNLAAARRLAEEGSDAVTGETLYAQEDF